MSGELRGPAADRITAQFRFTQQRRKAFIETMLAIFGRRRALLAFADAQRRLRLGQRTYRGLQEVPLDRIVGSLNRYQDFTRTFLPRRSSDRARWTRLDFASGWGGGLPPVELYLVGGVYFVADGNHRISVARAAGARTIQAYVWEYPTRVALTPEVDVNELILKEEQLRFLEQTRLDQFRPDSAIACTKPGAYRELLEHVAVHRYFLGLERQREVSQEEAVASWHDHVYRPAVEAIHRHGVLAAFPGRSEADLYLWVMRHLYLLRERYGPRAGPDEAAAELLQTTRRPRGRRRSRR